MYLTASGLPLSKKSLEISKRNHGQDQRNHFKNRVLERFGLTVNRNLYMEFIDAIYGEKSYRTLATFLCNQSRNRLVYLLEYNELEFVVIFSKYNNEIVTILPENNEYYLNWESNKVEMYNSLLEQSED